MGGYYWLPEPSNGGIAWAVLTCHDLGLGPEVGHVDLWPAVVERLAATGAGMRGRCGGPWPTATRACPGGGSPGRGGPTSSCTATTPRSPDWEERLLAAFRLGGRPYRLLLDEHERMLPGDPERIEEALGVRLFSGRPR